MSDSKQDPRVIAIRADPVVGRGTCSTIDECWDSSELVEVLDDLLILDPAKAVAWTREHEDLLMGRVLDQRWGGASPRGSGPTSTGGSAGCGRR